MDRQKQQILPAIRILDVDPRSPPMQSTIGEDEANIIHKRSEKIVKWTGFENMENGSNTIEVGQLWAQIGFMESQRRFDGHAYPGGARSISIQTCRARLFPGWRWSVEGR
jgi:hypothetical protein